MKDRLYGFDFCSDVPTEESLSLNLVLGTSLTVAL